jgi:hypothetical protein
MYLGNWLRLRRNGSILSGRTYQDHAWWFGQSGRSIEEFCSKHGVSVKAIPGIPGARGASTVNDNIRLHCG